jgi:sodium/proline symporter
VLILSVVIYGLVVTGVGAYFFKRVQHINDFILGNRGMNFWVSGLSAQTSLLGGWVLLGLPALGFSLGLEAVWLVLGLLLGTFLGWRTVAFRLRIFSLKSENALTLPAYFQKRFRTDRISLRLLVSVILLAAFMVYTAAGLSMAAGMLQVILGVGYLAALVGVTLLVVAYVALGGFVAVSWTDVIQSLMILTAAVVLPLVTLGRLGGAERALAILHEMDPEFLSLKGGALGLVEKISFFALGLGILGQPHVLARFMAMRDPENTPLAALVGGGWTLLVLTGALAVGVLGRAYYPGAFPFETDMLVYQLLEAFFEGSLGIFLQITLLAALMSTIDSKLMVTVSVFMRDFYRIMVHREIPNQTQVRMGRFLVVLMALATFLIAMDAGSSVLGLVGLAWIGLGGTLGPALIFSLYYPGVTYRGVLWGILTGGATLLFWELMLSGGAFDLTGLIPGAAVSSLVIWQVSKRDSGHQDREHFEELMKW